MIGRSGSTSIARSVATTSGSGSRATGGPSVAVRPGARRRPRPRAVPRPQGTPIGSSSSAPAVRVPGERDEFGRHQFGADTEFAEAGLVVASLVAAWTLATRVGVLGGRRSVRVGAVVLGVAVATGVDFLLLAGFDHFASMGDFVLPAARWLALRLHLA
ncbi:hypothetical protein [Halomarina litorea]|uniref:hypothetical protein n=1 Tax=Halomarina litorea TaxID=2961595 RepID=UPI0020C3485B|nr:hypothetical protein [Halomarina sp. BCD28]